MRRSRFSDEQIIAILKEHAAGLGTAELCREHGVGDATFYTWRSRYGGMEPDEADAIAACVRSRRETAPSSRLDSRCTPASSRASTAGIATNAPTTRGGGRRLRSI